MDYALPSASLPNSACDRDLAILCSCRQTAVMLQQQAQQAGWRSRTYRALADVLDQPDELPDDILWDDSLLTCLPNFELAHNVEELLDHLTEAASHSRLIACIGLENLHLWPALRKSRKLRDLGQTQLCISSEQLPLFSVALTGR